MEKLTERAVGRGREHRLEISLNRRRSGFSNGKTRKIRNALEVETPPPPSECKDFLLAVFEQRFKANLFLLLSLYCKETGRPVPAVLLQWFEMELNEMSEW